jgi:hypothetical protein
LAQAPYNERCFAGRTDRDLKGSSPNPCRQVERAQFWIIGDVAPDVGALRIAEDRCVRLPIVGRGEDQGPTLSRIRCVGTPLDRELTAFGHLDQRLHDFGRDQGDTSSFFDEALYFAQGNATTSDNQNPTIFDFQ